MRHMSDSENTAFYVFSQDLLVILDILTDFECQFQEKFGKKVND